MVSRGKLAHPKLVIAGYLGVQCAREQSTVGSPSFRVICRSAIMQAEHPTKADKSAVGAINRPLRVSGVFRSCIALRPSSMQRPGMWAQ